MAPSLRKGALTYQGQLGIERAWAFLPDLARATVLLAEQRETLDRFVDVPFTGYTLTAEKMAEVIALSHHEKWNGTGYPEGLTGEEIPESARIVAIADVFDALTMQRPYKKAWTDDEAFAHLTNGAGDHFDPDLVDCFLSIKEEIIETKRYWNALEAEGSMISIGSLL